MIKSSEIETEEERDEDETNHGESEYLFKNPRPQPPNYANLLQRTTPRTSTQNTETNANIYQLYSSQLLNALNDKRSQFQLSLSVYMLLIVNSLERFAYYGLICNYILYLNKQPLYWESYNASIMLFIFLG
jgi:hypothetical protein